MRRFGPGASGYRIIRLALPATVLVVMAGLTATASAATVSPGVTARNASVWSEISFRGLPKSKAGAIRVTGSSSGLHGFHKRRHSDGRGFSLVMGRPFDPAEQVTVETSLDIPGTTTGDYVFTVENLGGPRFRRSRVRPLPVVERDAPHSRPNLHPFALDIRERKAAAGDDPIFVGSKAAGSAIFSAAGQLIWFKPMRATDLRTQTWRGKPVLTWYQSPTKGSGLKRASYIIADRSYRVIKRIVPGDGLRSDSHEFRITPRGTAYITSYRTVQRDLRGIGLTEDARVVDSIAQEIDLKTGRVIWEWHSMDQVPVRDSFAVRTRREGGPFDYFHINSVIDTPDGNIMVSGRSTSAVYKISRRTGRVIWALGGKQSDFEFGPGAAFSWQHDAEPLSGNRVSLFDNASAFTAPIASAEQSRGVVLKLDEDTGQATLESQFLNPQKPLSPSQANVQPLASGNFFIGWGQSPLISEHTPDGRIVFDASLKGTNTSYRAYRLPWSSRPRGRVAIATGHAGGLPVAWVSWNGDTEVRRWRVLAGTRKSDLAPSRIRARTGFETRIAVPPGAEFIKIQGVEADGKVIGSTSVTAVG